MCLWLYNMNNMNIEVGANAVLELDKVTKTDFL